MAKKKKRGNQNNRLTTLALITAILNLIVSLISLAEKLTR